MREAAWRGLQKVQQLSYRVKETSSPSSTISVVTWTRTPSLGEQEQVCQMRQR